MNNLKNICLAALDTKGINNDKHKKRLEAELKEIETQNEAEYFLDLYEKKTKYKKNEHNLLTPFLLGIVDDFDINKDAAYNYGEFPDIDTDYLPQVRTYIKDTYTRKLYGDDYVCNIATYTTFGLRSSLIDMARVLGLDRNEIIKITTSLGVKDDEGEVLTWDKALDLYDELKEYLDKYPELADAAKRLLHRNRNIGQHASGVIISGVPIKAFVPLVLPKGATVPCAAWVEGLHGTDLGAVGLVKFDFLSLDGNMKNALTVKHIKKKWTKIKKDNDLKCDDPADCLYELNLAMGDKCAYAVEAIKIAQDLVGGKICALPGRESWSDTSYLNDEEALAMADRGDLKMIFQFDGSEGIRRLTVEGGVTSFDDLVAYAALYRPGPMKKFKVVKDNKTYTTPSMAETYTSRKRGKEEFEIHPILEPFLKTTYGVLVYQEQVMQLLNTVGKIPLKDCETVRKAISKKKIDKFIKYQEMFVANGQEILGWDKDKVQNLWEQVEAFAGYGFNKSHSVAYTYISSRMLYLKCHYPLEFYAAVMSCTKAGCPKDYIKLKEYKQEIEKHGIEMERLNLNKSGYECDIVDDKILYGFSKIKGIGEDAAIEIVKHQHYDSFVDFLVKFGMDAKTVQALIALGLFKEADPLTLYQFYEVFKDFRWKEIERNRRYHRIIAKYKEEIVEARKIGVSEEEFEKLKKKTIRAHENFVMKNEKILPPSLSNFNTSKVKLKQEIMDVIVDKDKAEIEYYGFVWQHPLEKLKNYKRLTIDKFKEDKLAVGFIEVIIRNVAKKQGKKAVYYMLEVEDGCGEQAKVTIWQNDFEQVGNKLYVDAMVKLQVKAPDYPYPNFTLMSYGRGRSGNGSLDPRVLEIK